MQRCQGGSIMNVVALRYRNNFAVHFVFFIKKAATLTISPVLSTIISEQKA
jgi:hypothetical protein